MNLAYLNLPVFGVLAAISKSVGEYLKRLPTQARENVKDTQWYKDAETLSKIHRYQEPRFNEEKPRWIQLKSLRDSCLFNILFYYRLGPILSIASSCLCGILIILGVYAEIHGTDPIFCFIYSVIGVPFWFSVAAFLWPVICVTVGALLKMRALQELRYNLKNLGRTALEEAREELAKVEEAVGN